MGCQSHCGACHLDSCNHTWGSPCFIPGDPYVSANCWQCDAQHPALVKRGPFGTKISSRINFVISTNGLGTTSGIKKIDIFVIL